MPALKPPLAERTALAGLTGPLQALIETPHVEAPACPWLIVQGDADEVVPPEAVRSFAQRLSPAPELKMLAGAGHFFHGRLNELRDVVLAFMREGEEAPPIAQPPGAT